MILYVEVCKRLDVALLKVGLKVVTVYPHTVIYYPTYSGGYSHIFFESYIYWKTCHKTFQVYIATTLVNMKLLYSYIILMTCRCSV